MTYMETHHWIKFHIDLSGVSIKSWIQLGECSAKCDYISGVPLRPQVADELHSVFLAKGVQATTAIEGNTLTEDEVRKIIEKKIEVAPSKKYLKQEVENIVEACNVIANNIRSSTMVNISPERIKEFNKLVLINLPLDNEVVPGEFREYKVSVGKYLSPSADEVDYLTQRLCNWLDGPDFKPPGEDLMTAYAIIKSIIAHIYIAWIHPFGDGNGRTARLVEFEILAQSGVPLPASHLLSNHYNATRTEYYRQLDKTSKSDGNLNDFISYAVQGLLDGLNDQIAHIKLQQIDVSLRNYIHEAFKDKKTKTWTRRRWLALDLSSKVNPIPRKELPYISPRIVEEYKNLGVRSLGRDLAVLNGMGLIEVQDNAYRIKKELILAFLPQKMNS